MEVLSSLIIAISQSILFYGKELGISILLFVLIGIGMIWYILCKKEKVVNKKALALMIPILLLSSTYFIYGGKTFYAANIIVILALTLLMFKMATSKMGAIKEYLLACIQLPFKSIENFDNSLETTNNYFKYNFTEKIKMGNVNIKRIATSLFIVLMVVGIVIMLLASADSIFASIFSGFGEMLNNIDIENVGSFILRVFICIIVYFLVLGLIIAIQDKTSNDTKTKKVISPDKFTINMLLVALNIVYLVFCYIQITSLFTKVNAPGTFNYAEYARSGFFQLMFVSFINFALVLISNYNNDKRESFIKILNIFLIILTIIIVLSSMYRMYMYETAYGLTYLRLFVYIILATELILFIPTIIYVCTSKLDILKWGGVIGLCVYIGINFANLENIIIARNLSKQNSNVDIDYGYISEIASSDSYSTLESLLNDDALSNENKLQIAESLLDIVDNSRDMKWQEFNISKYKIKDKNVEELIDIEQLKIKVRAEEIKLESSTTPITNYVYYEMVNDLEGYRVNQIDSASSTALWQIEKTLDGGLTYEIIATRTVKTASEIVFFENGLGFLTLPDSVYCAKADLYISNDSGNTFTKLDFPNGEFSLSYPEGKSWDDCYDYFHLPTQETDDTLEVLASGGYQGGYNNGNTRAKYISIDNGHTWTFVGEVLK